VVDPRRSASGPAQRGGGGVDAPRPGAGGGIDDEPLASAVNDGAAMKELWVRDTEIVQVRSTGPGSSPHSPAIHRFSAAPCARADAVRPRRSWQGRPSARL
jgi:hypothetical protein